YETVGDGAPVVLLHGFTNHCLMWGPQLDALVAAGYQAALVDFAGHGRSSPITEKPTMRQFANDALAVADDLALDTFCLCGLSLGGMVTQQLLTDHPDRVRAAVVVCAPPSLRVSGAETGIAQQQAEFLAENGPVKRLERSWPRLASEQYRLSPSGQAYYSTWRQVLTT